MYLGGGVGSKEDSLYKFKKAFNRNVEINTFYIGRKIFNKDHYSKLVGMREDWVESGFFPEYRA